ncbi:MAG TPA: hypothetical protein VHE55_09320 [Fimbriimonadaceae bacterium]|nr:hypothetical protein [Fimbriimonadaceae bacterium]
MNWTDKKQRERFAFERIYDPAEYVAVLPGEEPDFVVEIGHRAEPFGVEVTELWVSEAEARLSYIPGYFQELIDGGPVRHRDDLTDLPISEFDIYDKDVKLKSRGVKGIFRKGRPVEQVVAMLADRLRRKEALIDTYLKRAPSSQLIVWDMESCIGNIGAENFHRALFSGELRDLIYRSRFGEIHLLSRIGKDDVFLPLRLLLLAEESRRMLKAFEELDALPSFADFPDAVCYYLRHFGAASMISCDRKLASFGQARVGVQDSGNSCLMMDFAFPGMDAGVEPCENASTLFPDGFWEIDARLRASHTFSMEMSVPARPMAADMR